MFLEAQIAPAAALGHVGCDWGTDIDIEGCRDSAVNV
jgi:hypothetical protein